MSGRPEISELVMRPLFSHSLGPFDPDLARERAFQLAQMLENLLRLVQMYRKF